MRIRYEGALGFGVTAKDLILATIGQIGVDGAVGHVVEYAGPAIEALSMEGRMTVCNMTIEGGGRAGMIAPDETTFEWVIGRAAAPDEVPERVARAAAPTTARAFDREIESTPRRSARWSPGAPTPGWSSPVTERGARARSPSRTSARSTTWASSPARRSRRSSSTACSSARARTRGSATCAPRPRWSRAARSPTASTRWSCPGSQQVKAQAEREGLDEVFRARRLRLARRRLLDVPGHEPRHRRARRARRLDLEPQLRGPPGPRRPLAPGLAADGRRGGDRGALRRHPRVGG